MSMEMKDIQTKDFFQGVTKAIVDQVPVANFFLTAIDNVKSNVLQRKFVKWQEMVSSRLETLENTVFDDLGENEAFATVLLKTTELAAQSNEKKMEYLANSIRYIAENEIKEDYLIVFLNYMNKYSLAHIDILLFYQNPEKHMVDNKSNILGLPSRFPSVSFKHDDELNKLAIKELFKDGLLKSEDCSEVTFPIISSPFSSFPLSESLKHTTNGITPLGEMFLAFFGIDTET